MASERSPEAAASVVEDGDTVVVDSARPRSLLEALAARSDLSDVSVYAYGYPYDDSDALASVATTSGVSLAVSMVPPGLRDLVADGTVSYVPRTLYSVARNPFSDPADGRRVALLGASAAGQDGYRLNCLSTFGAELADQADVTLVEENTEVPPTSSRVVRTSNVTCVTESGAPSPVLSRSPVDETVRDIARNIASLIPEYPTLQLGVGSTANALGDELIDRGPFDIWSGLVGEPARTLAEAGAVRGLNGVIAAGHDDSFYEWVETRDDLRLSSPLRVHDQSTLTSLPRFVAVNSALQVDLTGQVNAETVEGRPLGGIGGQMAFMRGASLAPDGIAIIALTSRTPSGSPKVVPSLGGGDPTTTPRHAVDAVVTEHGVADLRNRSIGERTEALLSVAHPDDRSELRDSVGGAG